MSGFQSIRAAYPEQPAQQKPEITDDEFIAYLHHFALKTPKWQRYLHSFTPTKWAF